MSTKQSKDIASSSEEAIILTEETYNNLRLMFKSEDKADQHLAQELLLKCDTSKSIYFIWRLARERQITDRLVNLRTKKGREFRDKCRLFHISTKSEIMFMEFLAHEDLLTPEIFQKFEMSCIKSLKSRFDNTFYNVSITIKPRYAHLTENKVTMILTNFV
jgi:hypothetical protein